MNTHLSWVLSFAVRHSIALSLSVVLCGFLKVTPFSGPLQRQCAGGARWGPCLTVWSQQADPRLLITAPGSLAAVVYTHPLPWNVPGCGAAVAIDILEEKDDCGGCPHGPLPPAQPPLPELLTMPMLGTRTYGNLIVS